MLFFLFFIAGLSKVLGQQSAIYTNDLSEFNNAFSLFKDKQYQSAQILFDKVKYDNVAQDVQEECAYYIGICAAHLNQNNADELIEKFVADYPTSSKQNQAYIEVAQYYFEQGKFPQALQYFDKVDENALSYDQTEKFTFQKGYAYFTAGDKKTAANYFNKVINSKVYGTQANYYLGFMQYEGNNYQEANKYFQKVEGEEKYTDKLSYFKADMAFKEGSFQKAIDAGLAAMPKSNASEKS
jgi:TolA-binding protein